MSDVAMPAHDALQLGADWADPLRLPVFRSLEMDCQRDEPGCAAPSTPHLTVVVRACHARYFARASLGHVNPLPLIAKLLRGPGRHRSLRTGRAH